MTDVNGSATQSSQSAGSPANMTINGASNVQSRPSGANGGDPLAALPDDLKSHPSLSAYRKGESFDLPGLVKEHVNLQSLIGKKGIVPPGEKDGPEAWDRYYNQLGRPARPPGPAGALSIRQAPGLRRLFRRVRRRLSRGRP